MNRPENDGGGGRMGISSQLAVISKPLPSISFLWALNLRQSGPCMFRIMEGEIIIESETVSVSLAQ